ncbi:MULTISPECIES: glycosyltransferase family 4 protein [unclassified Sphingomonas]|uniref:glycosyltransferase family 4 protein n=1 Tax=unclassified Sphingomonas TaxID=196159 RepID=UPI000AAD136D|nr:MULTISPECIES: glycosyltransferase family 1 protein [unclassified Sphingomonas]
MPAPRDSALPHLYVNGRFLGRSVTGVERFAHMVLDRLHDRQPADGRAPGVTILAPPGIEAPAKWPRFAFRTVGSGGGHRWEQLSLPAAARDGVLLGLCNSNPVRPRRALTVIHDAAVYDFGQGFARSYRLLHRTLGRLLARRSHIATVSRFSQARLAAILHLPPTSIAVIPNAADHIRAITPDPAILAKHDLTPGRYLLIVGSFAPNKNLPRTIAAFQSIAGPEDRLVLVGAAVKSFAANGIDAVPDGVILPGRIDDESLMALYAHARALVFPSLYEGFGIPPLEAMQFGTPVVASTIPPVREVCDDAALYCDPEDATAIGTAMRRMLDDDDLHLRLSAAARARALAFRWDDSADRLLEAIAAMG